MLLLSVIIESVYFHNVRGSGARRRVWGGRGGK